MNPTPAAGLGVIYECPDCETRYLNQRRCPDCNLSCRRIDTGGTCPHCDEPVAVVVHPHALVRRRLHGGKPRPIIHWQSHPCRRRHILDKLVPWLFTDVSTIVLTVEQM
jgi:hypothetical protein